MTESARPTTAYLRQDGDRRLVVMADRTIRVSVRLITEADPNSVWGQVLQPDGTLRLDTDGEYVYRFAHAESDLVHVYERVAGA